MSVYVCVLFQIGYCFTVKKINRVVYSLAVRSSRRWACACSLATSLRPPLCARQEQFRIRLCFLSYRHMVDDDANAENEMFFFTYECAISCSCKRRLMHVRLKYIDNQLQICESSSLSLTISQSLNVSIYCSRLC